MRPVLVCLLLGSPAAAQGPARLVQDLLPGQSLTWSTLPHAVTSVGGQLLFGGEDVGIGFELFRSDGTIAGTGPVKDLEPLGSSLPDWLVAGAGRLFFTANTSGHGRELWMSDGTAAGTVQVADLLPGRDSSDPQMLTAVGGAVLFRAFHPASGWELWRSDGTAAGTGLVYDVAVGPQDSNPTHLTEAAGLLYFAADDWARGRELWRSDGTVGGTWRVDDTEPGRLGSDPRELAAAPGLLFFSAATSTSGRELWCTTGLPGGTFQPLDIHPGPGDSNPTGVRVIGPVAYFSASEPGGGTELWRSDGSTAGTWRVLDLAPGPAGSNPRHLIEANGLLVFVADDGVHGEELWRSDGTAGGTYLVGDLDPAGSSMPQQLLALGNLVLFVATTPAYGQELWAWPLAGAPYLVADLEPGPRGAAIAQLMVHQGVAWFVGGPAFTSPGVELWRSDGTAGGTWRVSRTQPLPWSSFPRVAAFGDGALVAGLDHSVGGATLWSTDGLVTTAIVPYPDWSLGPSAIETAPGLAFVAGGDPTTGAELYRTDGTPQGTTLLRDIMAGPESSTLGAITRLARRTWVFAASDAATGNELWRTDGTPAGTVLVADLWPGPASSLPANFVRWRGRLLFTATAPGVRAGLWSTDGTPAGTALVVDLDPTGVPTALHQFLPAPDGVYVAGRSQGLWALWRTDGTAAGTVRLALFATPAREMAQVRAVRAGGLVWFAGGDPVHGQELWRTDGTLAGTALVADIRPGSEGSAPSEMVAFGDGALFLADDGVHGREPWFSDGTAAGTRLVVDIRPGPGSSGPGQHSPALFAPPGARRAVFAATDGRAGVELWRTDGTAAGTVQHQDLSPGMASSQPHGFTLVGAQVLFTAADLTHGSELWAMPAMAAAVPYGAGCPGESGRVAELAGAGSAPVLGGAAFGLQLTAARAQAPALLVVGLGATEVELSPRCDLLVARPVWYPLVVTDGSGEARLSMPIPSDPALDGRSLFVQAAVVDPAGAFGAVLAFSSGLRVIVASY